MKTKPDNNKGKSLEDMMAYVDEHGNLTSTPTDPSVKRVFLQEDIQISVPKDTSLPEGEVEHQGMVTRFNDSKGYGFIRDQYGQDIFFHISNVEGQMINERDKVTFKTEKRDKGLHAIEVKIIK